jgi:hypothetical protein
MAQFEKLEAEELVKPTPPAAVERKEKEDPPEEESA